MTELSPLLQIQENWQNAFQLILVSPLHKQSKQSTTTLQQLVPNEGQHCLKSSKEEFKDQGIGTSLNLSVEMIQYIVVCTEA